MSYRYKDQDWYGAALTYTDRKTKTCTACGCHDGDSHPFTKNTVCLDCFVTGNFWGPNKQTYMVICVDCWSMRDKIAQGKLF